MRKLSLLVAFGFLAVLVLGSSFAVPYDFGGMYSKISDNPATGDKSCPTGYVSKFVWGSTGTSHPGDNWVKMCYREHVNGRDPLYDFGGAYSNKYVNAITQSNSCPPGYVNQKITGVSGVDNTARVCYRDHIEQEYSFGGFMGKAYRGYDPDATSCEGWKECYNNPDTGAYSCPVGYDSVKILGTTDVDWSLNFCYLEGGFREDNSLYNCPEGTSLVVGDIDNSFECVEDSVTTDCEVKVLKMYSGLWEGDVGESHPNYVFLNNLSIFRESLDALGGSVRIRFLDLGDSSRELTSSDLTGTSLIFVADAAKSPQFYDPMSVEEINLLKNYYSMGGDFVFAADSGQVHSTLHPSFGTVDILNNLTGLMSFQEKYVDQSCPGGRVKWTTPVPEYSDYPFLEGVAFNFSSGGLDSPGHVNILDSSVECVAEAECKYASGTECVVAFKEENSEGGFLFVNGNAGIGREEFVADLIEKSCDFGEQVVPFADRVYWSDLNGAEINETDLNDYVLMVAEGSGFQGASFEYEIYSDNLLWFDTKVATGSSEVSNVWMANESGTYYFEVTVGGETLQSDTLTISDEEDNTLPTINLVSPFCGADFEKGDIVGFEFEVMDADSLINFSVDFGEGDVENLVNSLPRTFEFNHTYSSGMSAQVVANVNDGLSSYEFISNIMVVDTEIEGAEYIAACIDEPKDYSNINSDSVFFNATSTRAINYTFADGVQEIPKDRIRFMWEFRHLTSEDTRNYNAVGSDPLAYLFYKQFSQAGDNWANLRVELV